MKKKLFFAVTVAAIPLLLTGCGEKKLTCTEKNESGSGEMKHIMGFKKDKVSSYKMEITESNVPSGTKESDLCEDMKKADYVKSCKGTIKGGKATIKVTLDVEKAKSQLGFNAEEDGYKNAKKSFEEDGATCK